MGCETCHREDTSVARLRLGWRRKTLAGTSRPLPKGLWLSQPDQLVAVLERPWEFQLLVAAHQVALLVEVVVRPVMLHRD
jgi:hypothetical protein